MGRQILVNGEVVPIANDTITAGDLKRQIHVEQSSWVVVSGPSGMTQVPDHEYIPTEAQTISVVPAYEYGS
jgi:hypothetical protein